MDEILDILRALRSPDGCPWDRKQTFATLKPYLLEETIEALDAIEAGTDEAMVEELGDVLLIVAFYAVIAEEEGRWRFLDVTTGLAEKLRRRHPHVFGDLEAKDANEVVAIWNDVKANEAGAKGRLAPDVARHVWGDRLVDLAERMAADGVDPELVFGDVVQRRLTDVAS